MARHATTQMKNIATRFALLPALLSAIVSFAHEHKGLEFHENKGQWPAQVLYRARTQAGAVFVEPGALTYVVQQGGPQHASAPDAKQEPYREHAYRMRFIGGRAQEHAGEERLPHYVNYFIGNDQAKWAGGVGAYGGAVLRNVYPGIGMRLDGHGGLKYEWLVEPGADPTLIRLVFEGQDKLRVEGGLLFIETSAGQVIEQRPVAWTEHSGKQVPVRCEYRLEGDQLTYRMPEGYDRSARLVIDPTVVFSSYSGSSGDNFGFTATYDDSGHLYGGGMVRSTGYPVTLGVVQSIYGAGENDIAVSKFTPTGNNLVWSTYIGGSVNEVPHSMVVNSLDELYILGTSNSTNFPTTTGCWDNSFNGGTLPPFAVTSYGFTYNSGCDIVVVHLNSTATALIGSTFVGGSGNDGLNQTAPTNRNYGDPFRGEIVLNQQEEPIIVTSTSSTGLFTSPNATQAAFGGGGLDAYAFRMDPILSSMLWATYHGGSGVDAGFGVQVSDAGDIYITGGTTSTNLPSAGTPAFPSNSGGGADGYIARFHPSGAPLLSTTYVGAQGLDLSYFVQLNTAGEVFVVGQTTGPYPITPGKYNNPNATQFLHKFSGDLSASLWSTRIGGSGGENISPSAFLVSNCGQIYFSGWAGSTNAFGTAGLSSSTLGLPTTADAYQVTTNSSDFYLMLLEAEAVSLGYATFFGGSSAEHVDGGTSRFDKDGIVYQAVCAGCQLLSYPTTPGVWSSTNNSTNCNLGVFKIDFEQNVQVNIDANITNTDACLGEPIVFTASGSADDWLWDFGDGSPTSTDAVVAHLYQQPGSYVVTLIGTAQGLCVAVDSAEVTINVVAPADLQPRFDAVPSGDCDAASVELFNFSTGSTIFLWSFGDGATSTQTNPVHAYNTPGQYTITLGLVDAVCSDTAYFSQTIDLAIPGIPLDLLSPVGLCDGQSVVLDAGSGFDAYAWSTSQSTQTISVSNEGDYIVVVTDGFCTGSDTISVVLSPGYPSLPDREVCPTEQVVLTTPFEPQSVLWSTGANTQGITVTLPGTYWYDAIDPFGCPRTDTVLVSFVAVASGPVIIPNVFSPNGDGYNDIFLPENIDLASFKMDIYSRWGTKVFSAKGAIGWNGKLDNNGEEVPDGTYFVILTYDPYCRNDGTVTHSGHVTLLR
jgi:gliding motility-associated-like protein